MSTVSGLQRPINSLELENYADVHSLKVVEYDRLPEFNSLDELFNDNLHVVLFYDSDMSDVGHYVLLSHVQFQPYHILEYFDPTGLRPDGASKKLNQSPALKNRKFLKEFCDRSGVKTMRWNNVKLQGNTMICGKWCVLRALSISTPFKEFLEIFQSSTLEPDVICDRLIRVHRKDIIPQ